MESILLWSGIGLIVLGWLALAYQAFKRMAIKDELDKFPQKKQAILLHRNYCRFTILAGIILLLIALVV